MRTNRCIALLLLVSGILWMACDDENPVIGGPCDYETFHGTVYIDSMEYRDSIAPGVENVFLEAWCHFIPDAGDSVGDFYRYDSSLFLVVELQDEESDSLCPSAEVIVLKMAVHATRREITKGSCVPVEYRIPLLDEGECHYNLMTPDF